MASSTLRDSDRGWDDPQPERDSGSSPTQPKRSKGCECTALKTSMWLMTIFFVLAAIAQLNDPDCFLWMCIYMFPATLTFLTLLNHSYLDSNWWWVSAAADLGAHSAFSFCFITAAADNGRLSLDVLHMEESRESCGLVIAMVWLFFLLCISSNKLRPCGFQNMWVTSGALLFSIFPLLCWVGYKVYWQMHCDIPEHCAGIL